MVAGIEDGRVLEIEFVTDRDTKNTVRFDEVAEDGDSAIGTLYVQKRWLAKIGRPSRLRVRIEAE